MPKNKGKGNRKGKGSSDTPCRETTKGTQKVTEERADSPEEQLQDLKHYELEEKFLAKSKGKGKTKTRSPMMAFAEGSSHTPRQESLNNTQKDAEDRAEQKLKKTNMDPAEIYYTQNSISSIFSNKMLIQDTLEDLRNGTCRVEDIPTIRVYKHRGQWCSMDNRRLWVFKQLKSSGETIPVIVVPVKSVKPIPERISLDVRVRDGSGHQRRSVEKRRGRDTTDSSSPPKKEKTPPDDSQ